MGDWPREHCKFNRCIIDQDHIFSLRKKTYRSPENKLKVKYHICWKMNRNKVTLRWPISWKPATNFDYHKKLQGWLNIYMYIVSICFFKKQQLMVMGPGFLCVCVCVFKFPYLKKHSSGRHYRSRNALSGELFFSKYMYLEDHAETKLCLSNQHVSVTNG